MSSSKIRTSFYLMNNKKIIITGVNGFVGRNFLKILKELSPDSEVYGMDKNFNDVEYFTPIKCDLMDKERVKSAIEEILPDYVFHFAGKAYDKDWNSLFNGNVNSTLTLLESIKGLNSVNPRIVVIGSAAEYGYISSELLPVDENVMPNPSSLYGASMCCRTNVSLAFMNMGCDIIIGRVFNTTGAGVSEHTPVGSFAKQIVEIEKGKKNPVIYTGNLSPYRDFIDIKDVARAFYYLALNSKKKGIYNICSGKPNTIMQILEIFLKFSSLHFEIATNPALIRRIDISIIYGNNQKIIDEIGWKPEIGLEESLEKTLNFYRT